MRQYVAALSADAVVAQHAAIAPAGAAPTGEGMEATVALSEQAAAEMESETECEAV